MEKDRVSKEKALNDKNNRLRERQKKREEDAKYEAAMREEKRTRTARQLKLNRLAQEAKLDELEARIELQ